MLLQLSEILSSIVFYLPQVIFVIFDIALITVAYLIRKENKYTYTLYFIISATVSIISSIIFMVINPQLFLNTLLSTLNLPNSVITMIITIINILFASLGIISAAFLFLGFYNVYQTHKTT